MADCVLRPLILLAVFMVKSSVYSEWNFTLLDNDLLYRFHNCTCTEVTCSSNNLQLSTTVTQLNTASIPASTPNTTNISATTPNPTNISGTTPNATNISGTTPNPTNISGTPPNTTDISGTTPNPTNISGTTPNTTNSQARISYRHCYCLNETQQCPDTRNTSSLNISTVWLREIQNSTLDICNTSQLEPPVSSNSSIPEWVIQVNNTDSFSNQSKFIFWSTDVVDLNLDSVCNKTTTSSRTRQATTTSASTTSTATATTTAAAETGTSGLIITTAIVGVNILLGIGVCAFILCKRRRITVNYRKQQKAIKNFSEATGNAGRSTNNVGTTRPVRESTNSTENWDRHNTERKTVVPSGKADRASIEEEDRHMTYLKTFA